MGSCHSRQCFSLFPAPSLTELFCERVRLKEEIEFIKRVDLEKAGKVEGIGPFEFGARFEKQTLTRADKLMM